MQHNEQHYAYERSRAGAGVVGLHRATWLERDKIILMHFLLWRDKLSILSSG
jgi:hypothetical protein